MPYMIISRSVTDAISLSVSKSKLVYSSLIFVGNKLTLICLLTQQQSVTVSVRNIQVILLIWWVLHLWGQKSKANRAYDTINHFVCNFAKCSVRRFKKNSPADLMINLHWSNSSQLKCLAVLSCYLSWSRIHFSDYCQFSDIHISQGNVAIYVRCGGILKYMSLLQINSWVCWWKNFKNRLTFGEVMGKSLVSCFFWLTVNTTVTWMCCRSMLTLQWPGPLILYELDWRWLIHY